MAQTSTSRAIESGKQCILVFEPDILVRQPLAAYLRECGYRVCETLNIDETIRLLSAKEIDIDMVLAATQGNQPKDAGFALAGWMRANRPDVEVILTGSVARAAETAHELCEDGPATSKPVDHTELLENIRRGLAARERSRH